MIGYTYYTPLCFLVMSLVHFSSLFFSKIYIVHWLYRCYAHNRTLYSPLIVNCEKHWGSVAYKSIGATADAWKFSRKRNRNILQKVSFWSISRLRICVRIRVHFHCGRQTPGMDYASRNPLMIKHMDLRLCWDIFVMSLPLGIDVAPKT